MANEEQLSILKQGVEVWNRWREKNPDIKIDLSVIGFSEAELSLANLSLANLRKANLRNADLGGASIYGADLIDAILTGADLREVILTGADLSAAYLSGADLSRADLRGTDLSGANLGETKFLGTYLRDTKFSSVKMNTTLFGDVDLSESKGLEEALHFGPSTIGTDTIAKSKGKIPDVFLRGCGLSDWEIEMARLYNPDLSNEERNKVLYKIYDLQAHQALQISPLFISYSHSDSAFIDKLDNKLTDLGIRFWRDIHDMKAGRMEKQIDRAIRQNPTVVMVLSEHSLSSEWVEHEVRTARELEKEMKRDVLCPVALDDSWKSSRWPKRIMEQITEYNILDFSAWEDDVKFEGMFRKLIDGLELFYKG